MRGMPCVLISIHDLGLGGAERVALQWASWLLEEGHRVVLMTGRSTERDFYPLPPGLEREREPMPAEVLARLGVIAFLPAVLQLRRRLLGDPPDLVLAITSRPAIKMLLATAGSPLPVVVAERNFPAAKRLGAFWRVLRRVTYPRAVRHLVQTEAIATWLRQQRLGSTTGGITVMPNALQWPLPRQEPLVCPDALLEPEDRVVLAAGTKPHQKGFDRLVHAFNQASASVPGWRLVIAGLTAGGWPKRWPKLEDGDGAPLLLGAVGNLADWYERADLFVLSSRYEGFPNVLLEAMASGTACLAIDCPSGPAELIAHKRSGWLVLAVPGEAPLVGSLIGAMVTLMRDEALRERLAQGGLEVHEHLAVAGLRRRFLDQLRPWLSSEQPPDA